ncbi:MAG: hypothetical protein NUV81_02800 [bacterium]|nr:hypothetical protein [bacterium]
MIDGTNGHGHELPQPPPSPTSWKGADGVWRSILLRDGFPNDASEFDVDVALPGQIDWFGEDDD